DGEITEECYCGTDIYNSGYCCNAEYQTIECITPCEEYWACENWTTCLDGKQNRTCTEENDCGTTQFIPDLIQSCGNCTTEQQTQSCITTQSCPGTQTCVNSNWNTCIDTPNDNCPTTSNTGTTTLKNFTTNLQPNKIKDGETITITILNENNNALQGAKIRYTTKTYTTNNTGTVKLKTQKEFTEITISASGYKKQTIILVFRTDECGNEVCEQEFENITNCPADCKTTTPEQKLEIYIFKKEGSLVVKITDLQGKEIENAKVTYGTQTKYTNTQGIVDFTEQNQTQNITAEKLGYTITTKEYNPTTTCIEGTTKDCKTNSCPGTQTCINSSWSSCTDTPNDNCPTTETPTNTTTIILAGILIIGIIIFAITKFKIK
ncbi:MAG: hypothetical protein COT90_03800, partial [Candidatus Diapherotrites archaeon CG10_big_fil_rev_8_21_14_0_10_31_34]